jgi:hypothetical protein
MGACLEYKDDISNLDMVILTKAKEAGLGWAGVSRRYVKAAKEKVAITEAAGNWSTTWATTLEFLGAYRKLMIDHLVTGYIAKLGASDKARGAYKSFMGDATFAQVVRFSALGSTNATSDYDMTLCGPAVPCIVSHMTTTFTGKTDTTTTHLLDSNFYIGPDILLRNGTTRYKNMRMFFPDGNGAAYNVAVPVPTATIVALEREYILKKLHPRHVEGSPAIVENYKQLVALGKKLDVIAYRNKGNVDAKELFKLLFEMKLVSMEAYHGISTVLVVVYGMQSEKMAAVRKLLSAECFKNACLENALDFANHWNDYAAGTTRTPELDQTMFVKLSKYLVRVLTCVTELKMKDTEDVEKDALESLEKTRKTVESVYADRAAGKSDTRATLSDFGIPDSGAIGLGSTEAGTGLVFDVYRYCTRPKKSGK